MTYRTFAAIIDSEPAIWGLGSSEEECKTDAAASWAEIDGGPTPTFSIYPCTERLNLIVETDGGDVPFILTRQGILDTGDPRELAGWVDSRKGILDRFLDDNSDSHCYYCGSSTQHEPPGPRHIKHNEDCVFQEVHKVLLDIAKVRLEMKRKR